MKLRILSVVHNHASLHPGGTEAFAAALHHAYGEVPGVEARLLAAVDPELRPGLPGTAIHSKHDDPSIYLFNAPGFDPRLQSRIELEPLLLDISWFLDEFRPDVVHIHHLNHFGVELIAMIKARRSRTKIILTLHDYYLICANDGILYRKSQERCLNPQPADCHSCFPDISPARFRARQLHIQRHLDLVDRIVAPSAFMKRRFVDWGVPHDRIEVVRNGWSVADVPAGEIEPDLNAFVLFGNLRRTKGTLLAMQAFNDALARAPQAALTLDVFGTPLYQGDDFVEALGFEVARSEGAIRLHERYEFSDVGRFLAGSAWVLVPSIWWENAPLVINEAFSLKRPVLCSDIGGMAEAVSDGVNGRHVRVGEVDAWSQAIREVAGDRALWKKLRGGIPEVRTVTQAAEDYLGLLPVRRAA